MFRKTLIALSLCAAALQAQPLQLERPVEKTKHSPWLNLGFGVGTLVPVSDEFSEQNDAFLRLALLGNIQFWPMTSMTFDLNYTAPHNGMGLLVGMEQQLLPLVVTPFVGGAAGFRYIGNPHENRDISFGNAIGPATEVNGGLLFFRTGQFRVRLKGGYEWVFNQDTDQSWNAEVGLLFSFGKPGLRELDLSK
jgi:hypothetical protein